MSTQPQDTENPARPGLQAPEAWGSRPELVAYARRLLGAQGEPAEDIVQEAYLRLHERLASGRSVREARPWLFRVVRNLALDERRRVRRGDDVRTSLEMVAPRPRGPLEVLQGREEARQALEGLGALPPREQRTVILDQAGLAPTAIAGRMQTTTNAVHQSLFRARRRMRDARAAAWALVPLPLIRLFVRVSGSGAFESTSALAPGSGGRLAGGAGIAGLVAAAVIGGGVAVDQGIVPHPSHHRTSAAAQASPDQPGVSASAVTPTSARSVGARLVASGQVAPRAVSHRTTAGAPGARRATSPPPSPGSAGTGGPAAAVSAPSRGHRADDGERDHEAPERAPHPSGDDDQAPSGGPREREYAGGSERSPEPRHSSREAEQESSSESSSSSSVVTRHASGGSGDEGLREEDPTPAEDEPAPPHEPG